MKLKNNVKEGLRNNFNIIGSVNSLKGNEESKQTQKNIYNLEDFEHKETITRGSFGIIELVKHIKTQNPFVLKRISKESITKEKQVEHLHSEKKICLSNQINRDFITKCYDTFQNDKNLYFVMEYIPGGDLHDMIKKAAFASLEKVKFYFSEVILAIGKRYYSEYSRGTS